MLFCTIISNKMLCLPYGNLWNTSSELQFVDPSMLELTTTAIELEEHFVTICFAFVIYWLSVSSNWTLRQTRGEHVIYNMYHTTMVERLFVITTGTISLIWMLCSVIWFKYKQAFIEIHLQAISDFYDISYLAFDI